MEDIWARGLNPSIFTSQTLGRHCVWHEIREPDSSLVPALDTQGSTSSHPLLHMQPKSPVLSVCNPHATCNVMGRETTCISQTNLSTPYILLLFLTTRTKSFISVKNIGGTVMNQNQSHKTAQNE